MSPLLRVLVLLVVAASALPAPAMAADSRFSAPGGGSWYQPQVPISALGRPMLGLDLSRFQVTSSFSVGSTGFGGTEALSVTKLSYRFERPMWMSVSLGNAWGRNAAGDGSMFLEGFQFGWRPSANTMFQIEYHDLRSPLQYGRYDAYSPFGPRTPFSY
jgi:hypothetical protein